MEVVMKQGLIVYLVGSEPLPEPFDLLEATRSLDHPADQIEIVSKDAGFFTVEDAWHFLATQGGCGRINLMVVKAQEHGRLRPISPAVRLCGYLERIWKRKTLPPKDFGFRDSETQAKSERRKNRCGV
jgi:hypothetical protein